MRATEILKQEHTVIQRVLDTLEKGANRLEQGQDVRPGFFIEVTDFIKGFTDGCHHKKEEGVLFKALEEKGVPVAGGPIGVMLTEHEMGRQYTRVLRAAAQRMESGDTSAREQVLVNARGYAALLRQHIFKEDNILFPLADRVFMEEEQAHLSEGFEHVEHEETGEGVHEKYLALAEALEKEMQG